MTFVDALVIALLLGAAWSGYRRGFINASIGLIGAIGGAVIGIKIAPVLMSHISDSAAKVAAGVACVVLGIGIGEIAGAALGRALSERVTWRPAMALDRGLGLVGNTLAVLVVAWMIALPLGSVPFPWLASAVRSSAVLGAVDKVMPDGARNISTRMRQLFDESGFPAILDPLTPTPDVQVGVPDSTLGSSAVLKKAGQSVLKVRGAAPSCSRRIEGSGFVIAPGKLLTNAHVVAGTDKVTVEEGTKTLDATVVVYDPNRDLAVLDVPGMTRKALVFDRTPAKAPDSAAPAGYPLDGPFTITPGRIRSRITLSGPNIYSSATVTRDVYTLRANVRAGNSGGPLLAADGTVLGVVFGAAIDKPDIGFALTTAEVAPVVARGLVDDTPAATGACTAD
ncbi:Colicin V production protein [Nakamurella panacisegetis]|uniref:Colicin V production protein n=1 Tax=Nakamurella panacisegetis TaxID=1090615 RepID=A0A1H0N8W6_9ACTN|nr:MarP family serine protease [Nakamurella panacisegetis]SDO89159.1 Colicin V production protein [Nakamurella panacisegetis]